VKEKKRALKGSFFIWYKIHHES